MLHIKYPRFYLHMPSPPHVIFIQSPCSHTEFINALCMYDSYEGNMHCIGRFQLELFPILWYLLCAKTLYYTVDTCLPVLHSELSHEHLLKEMYHFWVFFLVYIFWGLATNGCLPILVSLSASKFHKNESDNFVLAISI